MHIIDKSVILEENESEGTQHHRGSDKNSKL
jgi:hypothetical protein